VRSVALGIKRRSLTVCYSHLHRAHVQARYRASRSCFFPVHPSMRCLPPYFISTQDGFFTCTICDDYSKSHPVPFKAHVVRCAAEHEGDSSPSSRNASSANERFASRPSGAAAAVVQSRRSLDDGDHQLEGSDEDGDRPPRKSKPISEKAIKRSTGALAKSRKADPPIKRRPRVNIDLKSASTRAIKTTARPTTAKGKERQLLSDYDDGDDGPVPPKASRRKALFVPSEAEPDPSGGLQRQVLEDNDDGIVFVLVRGERMFRSLCSTCTLQH
jgi:hypothetical protein